MTLDRLYYSVLVLSRRIKIVRHHEHNVWFFASNISCGMKECKPLFDFPRKITVLLFAQATNYYAERNAEEFVPFNMQT